MCTSGKRGTAHCRVETCPPRDTHPPPTPTPHLHLHSHGLVPACAPPATAAAPRHVPVLHRLVQYDVSAIVGLLPPRPQQDDFPGGAQAAQAAGKGGAGQARMTVKGRACAAGKTLRDESLQNSHATGSLPYPHPPTHLPSTPTGCQRCVTIWLRSSMVSTTRAPISTPTPSRRRRCCTIPAKTSEGGARTMALTCT